MAMTEQQIRARSKEKVEQIMALAKSLQVKPQAMQRLDITTGFLKLEVHWLDAENYPLEGEVSGNNMQETTVEEVVAPEGAAPISESHADAVEQQ